MLYDSITGFYKTQAIVYMYQPTFRVYLLAKVNVTKCNLNKAATLNILLFLVCKLLMSKMTAE